MEELITYRQELLSALEEDIILLARVEAGISSQGWYLPLGSDQPTPHYILSRLWVEESQEFTTNIRRILDEEMPVLPVFDAEAWIESHYDPEEPAGIMIEYFASLRKWEIGLLCKIPPPSWSRAARHPRWGVHTLQWWVELQRECSHQLLSRLIPLLDI
jgi:hypothetical protein